MGVGIGAGAGVGQLHAKGVRKRGHSQQLVLRSVLLILPPHFVSTRTGAAKTRRQPERDHIDPRAMVGNGGSCGLVCPPPTCVLSLDVPFLPIRGFGEGERKRQVVCNPLSGGGYAPEVGFQGSFG